MFINTDQVPGYRVSLNKFQRTANIQTTFINQNTIKVEINKKTHSPQAPVHIEISKHTAKLLTWNQNESNETFRI